MRRIKRNFYKSDSGNDFEELVLIFPGHEYLAPSIKAQPPINNSLQALSEIKLEKNLFQKPGEMKPFDKRGSGQPMKNLDSQDLVNNLLSQSTLAATTTLAVSTQNPKCQNEDTKFSNLASAIINHQAMTALQINSDKAFSIEKSTLNEQATSLVPKFLNSAQL